VYNIEIGYGRDDKSSFVPKENIVANNLIVGYDNTMITIYTPPIDQVFEGNICYPTARGSLGVKALPEQIKEIDPKIEKKDGLWRLTEESPARHAAVGNYGFVTEDMDGQTRNKVKDVGADEYSTAQISRRPVDVSDVGPDSEFENNTWK